MTHRLRPLAGLATLAAAWLLTAPAALAAKESLPDHGENTPLDLTETPTRTAAEAPGSGSGLVRTIVGLAIVIGVIYGLAWVLRQVKAGKEEKASGTGLATVASVPLGPNRALHLVRAGHEYVLVGVADHAVTPIRAYREEEARSAGLLDDADAADAAPAATRSAGLRAVLANRGAGRPTSSGSLLDHLRQLTVRR